MNLNIKKKGLIIPSYSIENETVTFKRKIFYFSDDKLSAIEDALQKKVMIKGANPFNSKEKDDSDISNSLRLECFYSKKSNNIYYRLFRWVPYEYKEASEFVLVKR